MVHLIRQIAFLLWALVAIIIGACMNFVAVALIIFVRKSSSCPRHDDGDALPIEDLESQQPPAESPTSPPAASSDAPAPSSPPLLFEIAVPLEPPPPLPPMPNAFSDRSQYITALENSFFERFALLFSI